MYLEKDIYITDIHSICKSDILDIYIHTHIYIYKTEPLSYISEINTIFQQ